MLLTVMLSGCFSDNNDSLSDLYNDGDKKSDSLLQGAEHIEFLYQQQRGGVLVSSIGRIAKVLDNQQQPHKAQRVLIRLSSGRKLIIQHNIEQAAPLPELQIGEMLSFRGIYRWNGQGGMIVSTYQQSDAPKRSGWLEYQDIIYQ